MADQTRIVAEVAEASSENRGKLKILFLGNSYNSLSVSCLPALLKSGHEVVVGEYDPIKKSSLKLIKQGLTSYGVSFVISKGLDFFRLQSLLILQRLGLRSNHYASLPALKLAHNLKCISVAKKNDSEFLNEVRTLKPDLIVVAGFSRILKAPIIAIPRLGCINVHPSLLPRYRGPEPYYWVLFNKEKKTGVTLHYIDEGIDSGEILQQAELMIDPHESELSLKNRCSVLAAKLLSEEVPLLAAGTAHSFPQNHSDATYYSFPNKRSKRIEGFGLKKEIPG